MEPSQDDEKNEDDNDDNDKLDDAVRMSDELMVDEIVNELTIEELDLTREDINLSLFSLSKAIPTTFVIVFCSHMIIQLTNLSKKIFNSATLRDDLKSTCVSKAKSGQLL